MSQAAHILEQSTTKAFFKYVSLNILSMTALSLYFLADTFFVANGVGEKGLVALNLVIPAYNLLNGLGLLLGIGGATRFAIAMGENRPDKYSQIFTRVVLAAAALGAFFLITALCLGREIAVLLGAEGEIIPLVETYYKTFMCFAVFYLLQNILTAFVRSDMNPRLAMTAMITASFANIVLDYLFIYPLQMGMFGASLATSIGAMLSISVLSLHFVKKKNSFHFTRLVRKVGETKNILFSGLPSFITECSTGVVVLVFNMVILGLAGPKGVGAYGIITNVALVCIAIFNGIGQGVGPLIGVHFGAGNRRQIQKIFVLAAALALLLGAVFYLCGLLFAPEIVSAFNRENDAKLSAIAVNGIHLYFISFLPLGFNIVTVALFACVARPKESFLISALRGFLLLIPAVLILPGFLGLPGVWSSAPVSEFSAALAALICSLRYFKGRKKQSLTNDTQRFAELP